MFCVHCGKSIPDDAVVCVGCGRAVSPLQRRSAPEAGLGAEKLRSVARTFLVIGIVNILGGVAATAVGWVFGILSVLLGIWEIVNAYRYWSTPPKATSNPKYIAVLEILNVLCGPFWSLIAGIANLRKLNSPEVQAYLAALQSGQISSLTGATVSPMTATKQCSRCAETIALEALVCRYCGHQFAQAEVSIAQQREKDRVEQAALETGRAKQRRLRWALKLAGGLCFVVGILLSTIFFAGQFLSSPPMYDDLGGFVGGLVVCPAPFLVVGMSLFGWGYFMIRDARAGRAIQ